MAVKGTNDNDANITDELYLVSVDSRGHSPSDLECYKEQICSRSYFNKHILDDPKNLCVKSQVAAHCGLDLRLYFHQHSKDSKTKDKKHIRFADECPHGTPDALSQINGIATLLTFNPNMGYYNHIVRGKAYVLLNNGLTPLSKRQVWGIQEFIREAKRAYQTHDGMGQYSHEAKMKLLTAAFEYLQGTWVPHSIYETRDPQKHHKKHSFSSRNQRSESGMSDAATCHHGCTHAHHDGEHQCCHNNYDYEIILGDDDDHDAETNPIKNHHVVSFANDKPCVDQQNENSGRHNHIMSTTAAPHRRGESVKKVTHKLLKNGKTNYSFYNKICH